MRPLTLFLLLTFAANALVAEGWYQWGRNGKHDNRSPVAGHTLSKIEAEVILDPFVELEKAGIGVLLVHYQAPVVDGNDVYIVVKSGVYTGMATRETQIWNVRNLRRVGSELQTRWTYTSDWKPVPFGGGVTWEPVYHTALTADAVWAPGAGGTIDKIRRADGTRIARFNPFGEIVDPTIFMAGPPAIDAEGNVYYNAIQLETTTPWSSDSRGAWLVKIAPNGAMSKATFASLTPNAPAATSQCTTTFATASLPWPPTPDAAAPTSRCGPQRPGINVAPAIASDGTIYTVSRSHQNARWGYLAAVNTNLTPKWSSSLRNRLDSGCNVLIPPNGAPGGCREGAHTGVDPADNQIGSGQVADNGTSSPVVLPDGRVLYGALTRYNYAQGHLMLFDADGAFVNWYGFGWDITPSVYEHDGTYSIVLKENRYSAGSYCGGQFCPSNRTLTTPHDPEQYLITSLDPSLTIEWQYRNRETKSCQRMPDGSVECSDDHPNGFEWCVNAVAVDAKGVTYVNAEDGYLYALNPNGTVRERIFMRLALGAAYTPLSIGPDGRIYSQNDGRLFVISGLPRRRAAGK